MNNDAWKQYRGDFNAMTDEEIEREFMIAFDTVAVEEEWMEAVVSWKAAGKPRNTDD